MQTLEEVKSGKLIGITSIKLSEEITSFPTELYQYADTLEVLDLSGNKLSELPSEFSFFKKLRILFLSNNLFELFPSVLAELPILDIVGFKANKIKIIPENAIPKSLRWLILTDNNIESLPRSIGQCRALQKVMLAGNALTTLPDEMAACVHIELLRISANRIQQLPNWVFELPNLAWLAFSGNPCADLQIDQYSTEPNIKSILWNAISLEEQIGEGASGTIYKARITETNETIAVKIFKGSITSDGFPKDEMDACIHAGFHKNLISVQAVISEHPEGKSGLIFKLIPRNFINLGLPPNFVTCTRDTFDSFVKINLDGICKIVYQTALVMEYMHARGIMHGDFYAHNILINEEYTPLLSDFGAATRYSQENKKHSILLQKIDVRAFGCLIDDLLRLQDVNEGDGFEVLVQLRNDCLDPNICTRPIFKSILERLLSFSME